MTDCLFPFNHAATIAVWLVVAIGIGWWQGGRIAAQVGDDPERYRERWGYRPRTSLIAVTLFLLSGLLPLAGQLPRRAALRLLPVGLALAADLAVDGDRTRQIDTGVRAPRAG